MDPDPTAAAIAMVDRHVVKMIVETAQLLCTAHRVLDGTEYVGTGKRAIKRWLLPDSREDLFYKATHVNHPSAVWVRESSENYNWLLQHFHALGAEYTYRYGKKHLTSKNLNHALATLPTNIPIGSETTIPSCMALEYAINVDPVINYRNYYLVGKEKLHRWSKRLPPDWMYGTVEVVNARPTYTIRK